MSWSLCIWKGRSPAVDCLVEIEIAILVEIWSFWMKICKNRPKIILSKFFLDPIPVQSFPSHYPRDHPSSMSVWIMDLSTRHELWSKSPNSFKRLRKSIRHFPEKCKNMTSQNDRNRRIINILKYGESEEKWFLKNVSRLRFFCFLHLWTKSKNFPWRIFHQKFFSSNCMNFKVSSLFRASVDSSPSLCDRVRSGKYVHLECLCDASCSSWIAWVLNEMREILCSGDVFWTFWNGPQFCSIDLQICQIFKFRSSEFPVLDVHTQHRHEFYRLSTGIDSNSERIQRYSKKHFFRWWFWFETFIFLNFKFLKFCMFFRFISTTSSALQLIPGWARAHIYWCFNTLCFNQIHPLDWEKNGKNWNLGPK